MQSGLPYSIFAAEPEAATAANYTISCAARAASIARRSAGRASAARWTSCGSTAPTDRGGVQRLGALLAAAAAGGYPDNLGFGNLGRNVLRGLLQRRVDLSFAKDVQVRRHNGVEFRWDIFNVFNTVNFGLPENLIGDPGTDFGKITDTVGGPRVMQFGARLRF